MKERAETASRPSSDAKVPPGPNPHSVVARVRGAPRQRLMESPKPSARVFRQCEALIVSILMSSMSACNLRPEDELVTIHTGAA